MSTEPVTHLEQVVAGTTTPVTHLEQVVAGTATPVTHLEHVISENSGGGALPALTDPASPSDVLSGKEYLNGSGAKQTGTLVAYSAGDWLDTTKPVGVIMTDKAIDSNDEYLLANRFNITEIIMPNAQIIPNFFAYNCRNLEKIVAPNVISIGTAGLNNTTLLKKAVFQSVKELASNSIASSRIEEAEFNGTVEANKTGLKGTPFIYSDRLHILVFRGNSVFSMGSSNSLRNTKFANGDGVVYVPQSLLTDYENATNWATYFTNGNQLKSIESAATDPDAPIDLTRYYIDGTPIPNS